MKRSYRKGRRSSDRVRVSFVIEGRYARFLLADYRYCHDGRSAPLGGPSGIVAELLRERVQQTAEDSEIIQDLAAFGLDLREWRKEAAYAKACSDRYDSIHRQAVINAGLGADWCDVEREHGRLAHITPLPVLEP